MFARTERLLLRPGWIEDAPALARAIADEAIVTKLARAPWPYSLADAEAFLARQPEPGLPDFLIFARTLGAPRLIGGIGLQAAGDGEVELGYWIARPFWGLGFATEAGRAVMSLARESLRLPKLVAAHAIDNPASGRVLAKLGFRPTGRTVTRHSVARNAAVQCVEFEYAAEDAIVATEPALAA
jgi:RimJ/RimL family protein N-acetyltransferase